MTSRDKVRMLNADNERQERNKVIAERFCEVVVCVQVALKRDSKPSVTFSTLETRRRRRASDNVRMR